MVSGIPGDGEKITVTTKAYTYDIVPYTPGDSSAPPGNVIITCTDPRLPSRFCTVEEGQIWETGEAFQVTYWDRTNGGRQPFTGEKIISVDVM